ncbi:MAG: hypothetical protein JJE30_12445 [Desulfuromonadales bacterium]|nr:hypothetical protein [Desulfuromonadales bacterium]
MRSVVIGKVREVTPKYVDGNARNEIWFDLKYSDRIPCTDGKRVSIDFQIGTNKFVAGVRKSKGTKFIWISPDLRDANSKKIRLSQVLSSHGYKTNQSIAIEFNGREASVILGGVEAK